MSLWRKDGDSNPGNAFGVYTLSRRASSTTRASFLIAVNETFTSIHLCLNLAIPQASKAIQDLLHSEKRGKGTKKKPYINNLFHFFCFFFLIYAKKPLCVGSCDSADMPGRGVIDLRKFVGDERHPAAFVPLAAPGDRSHVRGVGFEDKAVKANALQIVGQAAVFESDDPADAEEESEARYFDSRFVAAGEAVHHPAQAAEAAKNIKAVLGCVARVDHNRQPKFERPLQLHDKRLLLLSFPSEVEVIVKPYLPHPDEVSIRAKESIVYDGELLLPVVFDFLGMQSGSRIEETGIAAACRRDSGNRECINPGNDYSLYAPLLLREDERVEIRFVLRVVDMAMGVNHSRLY